MEIIQLKKERKEKYGMNWETRFKMEINTYLSIITLNSMGRMLQSKDTEWKMG